MELKELEKSVEANPDDPVLRFNLVIISIFIEVVFYSFPLGQKFFKKEMMHRLIAGSVFVGKMRMQGEGSRTFCCSSEIEPSECNCFQIFGSLLLREGEGEGSQMLPEGCLPQPRRFSKRRCTL